MRFAAAVRSISPAWLVEVVQAYASVAVFFDLARASFDQVAQQLRSRQLSHSDAPQQGNRRHIIPCCYEFPLDQQRIAEYTGLPVADIIAQHVGQEYTVYAIGFCPGFPYLGYLSPALSGVPRLATPRLRVEQGSVGLTGRQTGIYTLERPGGWNLVGRTPLQLVDVADEYFSLRTGDRVTFQRIETAEFNRLRGERL